MRRLFLLGVYFTMTPLFIFGLIFYQLFLLHQHSNISGKVLGASTQNVDYRAIPERSLTTEVTVSASEARVDVLRQFLGRYGSPLEEYSKYIVEVSDRYSLDYRLLPAIAMQESTLCKKAPAASYNCWGFGIYGDKVTRFASYPQALDIVAATLKKKYIDQGLNTPEEIMVRYTPPSVEKGGAWASGIHQFLGELQ